MKNILKIAVVAILVTGCSTKIDAGADYVPAGKTVDFKLAIGDAVRSALDSQTLGISFEEGDAVEINGIVYDVSFDSDGNPELRDVATASDNVYRAMFAGDNSFFATSDKITSSPTGSAIAKGRSTGRPWRCWHIMTTRQICRSPCC